MAQRPGAGRTRSRPRPPSGVLAHWTDSFPSGHLLQATLITGLLPMAILVWNNRGYGEIKKYMAERGIPQIGVDIYTPDLLAIARGFGCQALRAESLSHLQDELRQAQRAAGPTLIEIDEASALRW